MSTGPRESPVLAAVIAYLATRRDNFGWRQNTGTFELRPGQWVKFGTKGCADWIGLMAPSGRFLAVETKRPIGGVLSQEQQEFRDHVLAVGGLYVVATSVAELEAALPPITARLPSTRVVPR